jgi:hypothetical protein
MKVKGKLDPVVMEKFGFRSEQKSRSTVSYSPSSQNGRNKLPGHINSNSGGVEKIFDTPIYIVGKTTLDAYAPYT